MTAELVPFDYSGHQVRTVQRDDSTWFVATDVCAVLGIRNPRDAVRGLDDDERDDVGIADAIGRDQRTTIISEPGLYSILVRSRRPEAKQFRRWVTHEVLPTIRRAGGYIAPAATADQLMALAQVTAARLGILQAAVGLADPAWLEAKTRHEIARGLGEEPELDASRRPLTVGEYLEGKGIRGAAQRSMSAMFGKRVKKLYRDTFHEDPKPTDRFVDGALRQVAGYTEQHRPLFDAVWGQINGAAS